MNAKPLIPIFAVLLIGVGIVSWLVFSPGSTPLYLHVECSEDGLEMEVTPNTLEFATRYNVPIGDITYEFSTRFLNCGNTYEWQGNNDGEPAFRRVDPN